jgi:hypothetical protein
MFCRWQMPPVDRRLTDVGSRFLNFDFLREARTLNRGPFVSLGLVDGLTSASRSDLHRHAVSIIEYMNLIFLLFTS